LTPAAAIISQAVFCIVGVIGVTGAILVLDLSVVARALIHVVDKKRDRCARRHLRSGCLLGEHTGQNSDCIRFLPLRCETRLAGPATIEIRLDIGFGERDAWRAAVNHAANGRPVTFAKGGHAQQMPECIERHGNRPSPREQAGQIRPLGVA
jgi:hypothetical protein